MSLRLKSLCLTKPNNRIESDVNVEQEQRGLDKTKVRAPTRTLIGSNPDSTCQPVSDIVESFINLLHRPVESAVQTCQSPHRHSREGGNPVARQRLQRQQEKSLPTDSCEMKQPSDEN
jgi:hypothetical protein